jgi:hypothetical protein
LKLLYVMSKCLMHETAFPVASPHKYMKLYYHLIFAIYCNIANQAKPSNILLITIYLESHPLIIISALTIWQRISAQGWKFNSQLNISSLTGGKDQRNYRYHLSQHWVDIWSPSHKPSILSLYFSSELSFTQYLVYYLTMHMQKQV